MKKWELKGIIENEIKAIALSEISKFYPSYLSSITGFPLKLIMESVAIFVQEESIEMKIEYNCEECSRTLINSNQEIPEYTDMRCNYCGFENEFSPEDGIVGLYLNKDYREFIRSNFSQQNFKKKEMRALLLV